MGEAKKKREALRQVFLAGLDEWTFEPTEWERHTVAEVNLLPRVKAIRLSDEQLIYMRMPAKECHQNAHFVEQTDPTGSSKHITGWWIQREGYVLHSVVLKDSQHFCVTPVPMEKTNSFDFVPDAKIEWRNEGQHRTAFRDGVAIGKGIRPDPDQTIAELESIRQKLLSGMDPLKAVRLQ